MAGTWWLIEEVGNSKHTNHSLFAFSTHDLARRSTLITRSSAASLSFQLTTSRRGRQTSRSMYDLLWYFNSRPHEEVDQSSGGAPNLLYHFNSRPREEVDQRWRGTETRTLISTHDLTRRSTRVTFRKNWKIKSFNSRSRKEIDISYCPRRAGLLLFQLTTSRRGRLGPSRKRPSVLIFQLTTSRGGRH